MAVVTHSSTQFVAHALGLLPCEPPAEKRGVRYGTSELCWLCGGRTDGVGWTQDVAIPPTFTQHNTAARSDSDAVCQSCAALTRADVFQALVARRAMPLKTWAQCGWHSYSHYVRDSGEYEAPVPSRMREILLDPPPGRWVLTLNTSGKKHTIFRATVATARDRFPVQVDEEAVWVTAPELGRCLAGFERLTEMGCSKDSVATGDYHPADVLRAGLLRWRPAELALSGWRLRDPALVALVRVVARSARFFTHQAAPVVVAGGRW